MSISLQNWVEFALIWATAGCLSTWTGSVRLHSRRRTQELRSAGVALAAHYEAVSRLVDEPAFPNVYKKGLVYFTEGVSDQEISEAFAASLSDKSFPADAEGLVLPEDLARLYRERPGSGLALPDGNPEWPCRGFPEMAPERKAIPANVRRVYNRHAQRAGSGKDIDRPVTNPFQKGFRRSLFHSRRLWPCRLTLGEPNIK